MKIRTILASVLLVVVITGLVWWLNSPPAIEQAKTAGIHSIIIPPSNATAPQVIDTTNHSPESGLGEINPPNSASTTKPNTIDDTNVATDTKKTTAASSSPFHYVLDPPNGLEKVAAALGMPSAKTRIPDSSDLRIKPPIAVYELSATELNQGAPLETAHLTRFHYLIEASGQPVMYAEVYSDPSANGGHAMTGWGGPYQDAIARALEQLSSLAQTREGSYEVRILRLLHVLNSTEDSVLWLKSDDAAADLFYALPPTWPPLEEGSAYNSDDFLKIIRSKALERANAARPPQTSGEPVVY